MLPDNLRQKQKEATRNLILATAIRLFGEQGIITTKTADIAKEAQISHGSIFSHFPTQEILVLATVENVGEKISNRLHELIEEKKDLNEILDAHLKCLLEFEAFYSRLIIERRLLPKEVTDTYIMIQSTISFHIGLAVDKAINEGKIKKLPKDFIFNNWLGLIHYYLTNSDLFASEKSVLEIHYKHLLTYFINSIKL